MGPKMGPILWKFENGTTHFARQNALQSAQNGPKFGPSNRHEIWGDPSLKKGQKWPKKGQKRPKKPKTLPLLLTHLMVPNGCLIRDFGCVTHMSWHNGDTKNPQGPEKTPRVPKRTPRVQDGSKMGPFWTHFWCVTRVTHVPFHAYQWHFVIKVLSIKFYFHKVPLIRVKKYYQ